jgi:4-hydroxy-L-threonine phosphate dehydrogenase PdxA
MSLPRIVITMGDPSGIGPEVVAKALARPEVAGLASLAVVGDGAVLNEWQKRFVGPEFRVIELPEAPRGPFPAGEL